MSAAAKRKSTSVTVHRGASAPSVADSSSIMQMIGAASRDKSVDVAKMERLVDLFERIKKNEAQAAFAEALVKMKPKLPVIEKNGKIVVRAKDSKGERTGAVLQSTAFALWEDIDEAITPILQEHGFALTFRTGSEPDSRVRVTAVLTHEKGHVDDKSFFILPLDTTGSKNNVQAVGSSTSYGKRYSAAACLNLRFKGEDDDGMAGGAATLADNVPQALSTAQIAALKKRIEDAQLPMDKFELAFGPLDQLHPSRIKEAQDRISQFKTRGSQKGAA